MNFELLYLIIGLLVGAGAAYFIAKFKYSSSSGLSLAEADELKSEKNRAEEKASIYENDLKELKAALERERNKFEELSSEYSSTRTENKNLGEKLEEQKREIEGLHEKFKIEFKNLANEILEDKSRRFTDTNKELVQSILSPLSDKIIEFRKRVDEIHEADTRSNSQLITHLNNLKELNLRMSEDAENLTKALKGDVKTMGSWGELMLEKILERSGLIKDEHYTLQESFSDESGRRLRPDAIIKLPDKRSIIIDSKVSLVAYDKFVNAVSDIEKESGIKEHIMSIRAHIKGLNSKEYQNIEDLHAPDFVLMFIPIESAFGLAMQKDQTIFNDAFDNNIVIVSPSTLLATLRTIENIWRRENQNKNALEIARQSGALYDKFVGFVNDLEEIGKRLDQTRDSYSNAKKKLFDGQGNIIRRIESIKELGAKASKSISDKLLDQADD